MGAKTPKHGALRGEVLVDTSKRLLQSPLALWGLSLVVIYTLTHAFVLGPIQSFGVMLLPIVVFYVKRKGLVYELLTVIDSILFNFGIYNKWNLVDENLYVGAVPLKAAGDSEILLKKLGITAVVSVFDTYHLTMSSVMGKPVQPEEWKLFDVQQHVINAPFGTRAIPARDLLEAANFVDMRLTNGEKVYIHCRSGRQLGAMVAIAYLIKFKNMTVVRAHAAVSGRGSAAFGLGPGPERDCLNAFERMLRGASVGG